MKFFNTTSRKPLINNQQGFTLIEMVVVISIFAVLSTVTLFSFASFTNGVTLENTANDIALRVVEAQRSATSGFIGTTETLTSSIYRPRYGVLFDQNPGVGNDNFTYFVDLPLTYNYLYDAPTGNTCPSGECVSVTTFSSGYGIDQMCENEGIDNMPDTCGLTQAYVSFTRPYLDADIYNTVSNGAPAMKYSNLLVELVSPKGIVDTIEIWATGQVEIKNGTICANYPNSSACNP